MSYGKRSERKEKRQLEAKVRTENYQKLPDDQKMKINPKKFGTKGV